MWEKAMETIKGDTAREQSSNARKRIELLLDVSRI